MFAPAGTPAPILDKVHAEILRITAKPAFRDKYFLNRAVEPVVQTRAEFAKFIAANRAFATRVAKESNIQPQ
jgi:tripartite-type tricarboxylate transporter receptor subunit TctC